MLNLNSQKIAQRGTGKRQRENACFDGAGHKTKGKKLKKKKKTKE